MINVWKHVPRIFTWKRVWIIQWILHFLSFLLGENLQETSVFGAAVNPWSNSRIGLRQLAELQIEKDRWMGTEEAANLQKIGGVGYRDFSKWPLSYNCDKCIYNHIIIYIYINHIINMIIMYPEINIMVGNHWTMKLSLYVNWCFHNIDVIYHLTIDCILYTCVYNHSVVTVHDMFISFFGSMPCCIFILRLMVPWSKIYLPVICQIGHQVQHLK